MLRHSILLSHALAVGVTWALMFAAADKSGMEPVTGTDLLDFRSPLVYGPIAAAGVIAVGVSLVGSHLAFQRVVLQVIPWMTSPLIYGEIWLYVAMLGRTPSIALLTQSLVPLGAIYVLTVGPWHLIRRWRRHGGAPPVMSA